MSTLRKNAEASPADAPAAGRSVWSAALGGLLVFTAIVGAVMPFMLLEDSFGLRLWVQSRGVIPAPQDVVIVALESRSSKALNLPNRPDRWPRSLHAELVRGLTAQGAGAVVFDLRFDRAREAADDQQLGQALRDSGRVLLATYMVREQEPLHAQGQTIELNTDQLLQPLPQLAEAAYGTAPFPLPKTQFGMRQFWLFVPSAGDEPTLALRVAALMQPDKYQRLYRQATGKAPTLPWTAAQLRALRAVLPTGHELNLYGPPGTVTTLTYDKALARLRDPNDRSFRGKVVLVGFSEFNQPENRDAYNTAFNSADGLDMSGVELMATAIANVLHEQWLRRPGVLAHIGILLVFGALLLLPWVLVSTRMALLLNVAVVVGYWLLGSWWFAQRVWLPLIGPLAWQLPVLLAGGLFYQQRRSKARIAQLSDTLRRYAPGTVIQNLLKEHHNAQGEMQVVCLCTDIASYTTRAETMTPQALREWLNDYFERVLGLMAQHDGHVVDVTGDAVLVLWVPMPDATTACTRALQAARALQQLEPELGAAARIGIHYGLVSFGEVGSAAHRELRAVGDTVNTTSRLQGANKSLGTRILISADVAVHLPFDAGVKSLGALQLLGKQQPIGVYAIDEESVEPWQQVRVLQAK